MNKKLTLNPVIIVSIKKVDHELVITDINNSKNNYHSGQDVSWIKFSRALKKILFSDG